MRKHEMVGCQFEQGAICKMFLSGVNCQKVYWFQKEKYLKVKPCRKILLTFIDGMH